MSDETMKTYSLVAPMTFAAEEVAKPSPDDLQEGQVLTQTLTGGVCGSDLPYFRGLTGRLGPEANEGYICIPGAPMHETVGEILHSRHPEHKPGDLVVGWSLNYRGLSPYNILPGDDLLSYNPVWHPSQAINLQPLACVIYAVERMGDVTGKSVAILGTGPIGMLFAEVLADAGAGHITAIDPIDHSAAAHEFKVNEFIQANSLIWSQHISDADRPQIVVEAVGHNTLTVNDALRAAAPQGEIFAFGLPDEESRAFDFRTMQMKDLTLRAGITRDKRRVLKAADEFMQARPMMPSKITTDVLGFDDVQHAYERANVPQTGRLKVVLTR